MNKRPEILIYNELIEPIRTSINELNLILLDINHVDKDYILKGLFAYVVSLFESSITECTERFLCSCPQNIPEGKLNLRKQQGILLSNTFSQDVIELLVNDYLSNATYDKAENFFTFFCKTLSIPDITKLYTKSLVEKKERRNILLHNNLIIDSKYIRNTKCDPELRGTKRTISQNYLGETIDSMKTILNEIELNLQNKYGSYTKHRAIKEIWNYLFNSPLMIFEQHWIIKNDKIIGYNLDYLKGVIDILSSSEKTILAYWLQNFSSSICDKFFKFKDLNMQIINNQMMIYMVEIFNKYPLILQD